MSNKEDLQESLIIQDKVHSSIDTESVNNASTKIEIKSRNPSFRKIDFEQALAIVGGENWYQIRAFLFFCSQWFFAAWVLQGSQFFMFPAQFDSKFCGNLSQIDCKALACQQEDPKEHMINRDDTMIGTFDMVCDDSKQNLMNCFTQIGSLFGFFIFGWIADNKGRRVSIGIAWLVCSIGALFMSLSWDYYSATVGYFIGGLGAFPAIIIQLSLLSEHSTESIREQTSTGLYVFYCFGELGIVGVAYAVPNWRYLTLFFLAIPMIIINFGIFLVYESPKYVHERNTSKAIQILNKIAKVNKRETIKVNALQSILHDNQENSYSYNDLFKYKSLRIKTIMSSIIFFATNSIYYGVTYSMSKIGLNLYTNALIIAGAETIANIATYYLIPKIRRKLVTMIGLGLCGVLLISFQFIQTPSSNDMSTQVIIQIVFAAIIRFFISIVYTVGFVYMTEMFPTAVRNLALGMVFAFCTIGSIASSYFVESISNMIGVNQLVTLGAIGLIGFVCTFPLKETFNQPLEDQIEELKQQQEQEQKQEEIVIEQS